MADVNNDRLDALEDCDPMDDDTTESAAAADTGMTGLDGLPAFFDKYGHMSENALKVAVDLCKEHKVEVENLMILEQVGDSLTAKLQSYLPGTGTPIIDAIAYAVSSYQQQRGGSANTR